MGYLVALGEVGGGLWIAVLTALNIQLTRAPDTPSAYFFAQNPMALVQNSPRITLLH